MATPGVLDINAVTPEMLREAGMDHHRFQREMYNIPTIPVTQEDRDKLGRVRQKRLMYVRISSIVLLVLSGMAILVGIVSILVGTEFPHSLGGGILAGFPCLLMGGLGLWLTAEGKKNPTGDTTTPRFRCIAKCHLITGFALFTFLLSAWGIAGVWSLVDCAIRPNRQDHRRWTTNGCGPDTGALTALAVFTFLITTALIIAFFVNSCSYFCVLRAFGFKSGYEQLLDIQTMRMAETNRTQAQTQQPVSMYGQQQQQQPIHIYGQIQPMNRYGRQRQPLMYGHHQQQLVIMYGQQQQQPVNMYGQPIGGQMAPNQQQYGGYQPVSAQGVVPSAPASAQGVVPSAPASDDLKSESDPPPSYGEVMNQKC